MKNSYGIRISAIVGLVLAAEVAVAQQMAFVQERPRNLIDMIFGAPRRPAPVVNDFTPPTPPAALTRRPASPVAPAIGAPRTSGASAKPATTTAGGMSRRSGGGGSLAVCVRTCDGFFFPVNYEGARGDDRYADACQASCPGAETEVYFKPPSADMHSAANAKGRNYTQLPNAFKYRTQLDNACSCKGKEETWAQALKGAEQVIGQRKGDTIVTEQRSDELTRPEPPLARDKGKDKVASAPARRIAAE